MFVCTAFEVAKKKQKLNTPKHQTHARKKNTILHLQFHISLSLQSRDGIKNQHLTNQTKPSSFCPRSMPSSRVFVLSHGLLRWNLCTPLSHEYHEAPQISVVCFFGAGSLWVLLIQKKSWWIKNPELWQFFLALIGKWKTSWFLCICARLFRMDTFAQQTPQLDAPLQFPYDRRPSPYCIKKPVNLQHQSSQQPWHMWSSCKVPPNFTKSPQE